MVHNINSVGGLNVRVEPLFLLLGICDTVTTNTHKRLFIFYASFYARKAILTEWKQPGLPTVAQWRALIDSTLLLYKFTYMSSKCPKKIEKIWGAWIKS